MIAATVYLLEVDGADAIEGAVLYPTKAGALTEQIVVQDDVITDLESRVRCDEGSE